MEDSLYYLMGVCIALIVTFWSVYFGYYTGSRYAQRNKLKWITWNMLWIIFDSIFALIFGFMGFCFFWMVITSLLSSIIHPTSSFEFIGKVSASMSPVLFVGSAFLGYRRHKNKGEKQ